MWDLRHHNPPQISCRTLWRSAITVLHQSRQFSAVPSTSCQCDNYLSSLCCQVNSNRGHSAVNHRFITELGLQHALLIFLECVRIREIFLISKPRPSANTQSRRQNWKPDRYVFAQMKFWWLVWTLAGNSMTIWNFGMKNKLSSGSSCQEETGLPNIKSLICHCSAIIWYKASQNCPNC